jgi:hypothetical protein
MEKNEVDELVLYVQLLLKSLSHTEYNESTR